jgi:hypothetical protein
MRRDLFAHAAWPAPHILDLAAQNARDLLIELPAGLLTDRIGALDGILLGTAAADRLRRAGLDDALGTAGGERPTRLPRLFQNEHMTRITIISSETGEVLRTGKRSCRPPALPRGENRTRS